MAGISVGIMNIRITEPVFFFGKLRQPGDILENVSDGPYRTQVIAGGLSRTPQFVEMAEEIKNAAEVVPPSSAAVPAQAKVASEPLPPAPVVPPPVVLTPVTKVTTPVSRTGAMLTALAMRRMRLEQTIQSQAQAYAAKLTELEQAVPATFTKGLESLDDRLANLNDLDASLKDLAGSNDPLGS